MESKICTRCDIEKWSEDFYNKHTECKICNSNRSLKRYFKNEDKISNQKKLYYEKDREKILRRQNNRYKNFKELLRSYAELEKRLKTMEEDFKMKD